MGGMPYNPIEKVEGQFHDQMWALANDSMRLERALDDARQIIYMVLSRASDNDTLCVAANHWLDSFGRDPTREARLAAKSAA